MGRRQETERELERERQGHRAMEGGKVGGRSGGREIFEKWERGRRCGGERAGEGGGDRGGWEESTSALCLTVSPHPAFATVPHFSSMQLSPHTPCLLSGPAFCSVGVAYPVLFLMPCNQALFSASFSASRGRERESIRTCQIEWICGGVLERVSFAGQPGCKFIPEIIPR